MQGAFRAGELTCLWVLYRTCVDAGGRGWRGMPAHRNRGGVSIWHFGVRMTEHNLPLLLCPCCLVSAQALAVCCTYRMQKGWWSDAWRFSSFTLVFTCTTGNSTRPDVPASRTAGTSTPPDTVTSTPRRTKGTNTCPSQHTILHSRTHVTTTAAGAGSSEKKTESGPLGDQLVPVLRLLANTGSFLP